MKPPRILFFLALSFIFICEFLSLCHLFSVFLLALASGYPLLPSLCLSIWFLIVLASIVMIVRVLVLLAMNLIQHGGLLNRRIRLLLKTKNVLLLIVYVVVIIFAILVTVRGWRYGVFFDSLSVVNPVVTIIHQIEVVFWIINLVILLYFQLKGAIRLIQYSKTEMGKMER